MINHVIHPEEALQRLNAAAEELRALRSSRPVSFMEVCGTHTVNAFRSGLHSLLPANVRLLSGPGCPVCVTSQGDIDQIIELAHRPNLTVCTYGDMMRVTGRHGSLADARSEGADVRVIYCALDAVQLAEERPQREVVLVAVGFETTAPATAAAVLAADRKWLRNFTILSSHKLIMPALRALLDGGELNVSGFVCPGHVAVITGAGEFAPLVHEYAMACAITGFEGPQIAAALAVLTEMCAAGERRLENLYPQAVSWEGNLRAQEVSSTVFEPAAGWWRGLGELPDSGLVLRTAYRRWDARLRYELPGVDHRDPPGCSCGDVILGRSTPTDCRLFGRTCTPANPVGPCMVSSEGTCQAWFKYGSN